jgi:hypothetical protein
MSEEIDVRVPGDAETAERRVIGEKRATCSTPSLDGDRSQRARPIDRIHAIERHNETLAIRPVCSADPSQRNKLALFVRPDVQDAPSCAPGFDELAAMNLRNVHLRQAWSIVKIAASVAGLQETLDI